MRARTPERLPVVLGRQEVQALLAQLTGTMRLVVTLLYGAGLRLEECLGLRVKDFDFERDQITVRQGKGQKDRVTVLRAAAKEALRSHRAEVRQIHVRQTTKRGILKPELSMENDTPVVHSDPEIMVGTPVFVGTRVPFQTLLDYLEAGDPLGDFLEDFPTVTREQAVAALEQAKQALLTRANPAR